MKRLIEEIRVRMSPEDKARFEHAARFDKRSLSDWCREMLRSGYWDGGHYEGSFEQKDTLTLSDYFGNRRITAKIMGQNGTVISEPFELKPGQEYKIVTDGDGK